MMFRLLADGIVVLHLLFVAFVVLGGLLVLRWRRVAWVHLPAAAWGTWIEFAGWICPLTPLENWLRLRGGSTTYTTSFIERYLLPVLYPESLSRDVQWMLGLLVVVVNGIIYFVVVRSRRKRLLLACVMGIGIAAGELSAQDGVMAFEVVSVKPNASGDTRTSSMVMPGARYVATNVTLRMLIKTAYQVHDDQIVGGPGWVNTDRFDLTAKGAGNPATSDFITPARLMLRPALADRFSLVIRRETRDIPVYALRQVRSDRGLGPQLRESPNCSGPARPLPAAPDALEPIPDFPCGTGFSRGGHLGARGSEFSVLVRQIGTWTDRVLIDRTALTGRYDWDMQWTPEPLTPDISVVPNRLPLETALRDQLGFRLEAGRDSVEVLVIDRVERPRPD